MPVDTSMYGNIQPVQIRDPLEQYSRLAQLKSLQSKTRLEDLQGQAAEQSMADTAAERAAATSVGGDISRLPGAYLQAGAGKQAIAAEAARIKATQEQAGTEHTRAQTADLKAAAFATSAASIIRDPSDEGVKRALDSYESQGYKVDPRAFEAFQKATPDQRRQLAINTAIGHPKGALVLKELFPETSVQDSGVAGQPPISTVKSRPGLTIPQPGQAKPKVAEPVDLAKVSPSELEAGYRYFSDGTLPPNMGRGVQGAAQGTRIRDIAAAISQNLGISPEEARANQLAFKGGGTALTKLILREAGVGANVRNFDFNADQALKLSDQVDRTGIPVVNAWMNAGRRSVSGNPALSAFDVAVKTTVNEFAQIVSGTTAGATTEGEKKKAENLLSSAQTPEQIKSVINQMRIESQNRMKSFADQKAEVIRNMRGKTSTIGAVNAAPVQVSPEAQKLIDKYAPPSGGTHG